MQIQTPLGKLIDWMKSKKQSTVFGDYTEAIKKGTELLEEESTNSGWVSVVDRLPTSEDADEDYGEVLTIQVGRKRPTMMKYWEIHHCPFTKYWMSVPDTPENSH